MRYIALRTLTLTIGAAALAACGLLDTEQPNLIDPGNLDSPAGAEALRDGALADFGFAKDGDGTQEEDGLILVGGLMTDEFMHSTTPPSQQEIDQRTPSRDNSSADRPLRQPAQGQSRGRTGGDRAGTVRSGPGRDAGHRGNARHPGLQLYPVRRAFLLRRALQSGHRRQRGSSAVRSRRRRCSIPRWPGSTPRWHTPASPGTTAPSPAWRWWAGRAPSSASGSSPTPRRRFSPCRPTSSIPPSTRTVRSACRTRYSRTPPRGSGRSPMGRGAPGCCTARRRTSGSRWTARSTRKPAR